MKESGFGGIQGIGDLAAQGPASANAMGNAPTAKGVKVGWKKEKHVTVSLADLLAHVGAPRTIDYLSLDVEGAEESVLAAFDFKRYTFLIMTIERPSRALRDVLRRHAYVYLGDHGCFGDQLWIHHSFVPQVERVLKLQAPLDASRDSGSENWFANCSVHGTPAELRLHSIGGVKADRGHGSATA